MARPGHGVTSQSHCSRRGAPPPRRLRRTWARWMRRQIARILPPPTPACAPGEPRGRVWRGLPLRRRRAAEARGQAPCPAPPTLCRAWSARPVSGPSLSAKNPAPLLGALGGAPRCCAPGWLPAAWLLDAAAAGRQLRIAAARRRGRGCAAAAPRARQRRRPPRCGSRVSGTAAARKWPHSVPNVANAVRGIP